jgi:hypothetical protein
MKAIDKKTGQVRVGLVHKGFRTIKKITFVVWEPPLNINMILFLVFDDRAATEIHHL